MFWTNWFRISQKVCIAVEILANIFISIFVASLFKNETAFFVAIGLFALLTAICITLHSFLMMISEMSESLNEIKQFSSSTQITAENLQKASDEERIQKIINNQKTKRENKEQIVDFQLERKDFGNGPD